MIHTRRLRLGATVGADFEKAGMCVNEVKEEVTLPCVRLGKYSEDRFGRQCVDQSVVGNQIYGT